MKYLISKGEITHHNSEAGDLTKRVTDSGVTGLYYGEIIGYADTLERLIELWIESPEHNSVLLDKRWNWMGYSVIKYKEVYVSVVNFSSGLLGSTDINNEGDEIYIRGLYNGRPDFDVDSSVILEIDRGEFRVVTPANNGIFFIYVYDDKGILTDQINIF